MAEPHSGKLALATARDYFAPGNGAFWRWSDDRSALELHDGTTVAVAAEALRIAFETARHGRGLPAFDAMVAILALARGCWPAAAERTPADELPQRIRAARGSMPALTELACRALPVHDFAFGDAIAAAIDFGLPPELLAPRSEPAPDAKALLATLRAALADLDEPRVARFAATGIDASIDAADVELPPHQQLDRLLTSLAADRRLAGIAALVPRLCAVLALPRQLAPSAERPQSGVAGIGNRGSLDRLTLAELANDADVLAVRIALNEATYLEREVPPAEPRHRRLLLLDAGIRMWGRPRVYGVAVLLALSRLTAADAVVSAFSALPDGMSELALSPRGVREHLERLHLPVDPRGALPHLFDAAAACGDGAEIVVITHRSAAEEPTFRACCREPANGTLFVAGVDGDGRCVLWAVTARGWRVVADATLDLSALAPPPERAVLRPAYYGARPFRERNRARYRRPLAIGFDEEGVSIRTRKQKVYLLRRFGDAIHLQMALRAPHGLTDFAESIAATTATPRLWRARRQHGSAMVDDQGLLHLLPDGDLPQITIVLCADERIAAWLSTGEYGGNKHLLPAGEAELPVAELWQHILAAARALQ